MPQITPSKSITPYPFKVHNPYPSLQPNEPEQFRNPIPAIKPEILQPEILPTKRKMRIKKKKFRDPDIYPNHLLQS